MKYKVFGLQFYKAVIYETSLADGTPHRLASNLLE